MAATGAPSGPLTVLMVGLNHAPEPVGTALYTTGLAQALAARGHRITLVAGKPYYPGWTPMAGHPRFAFTRSHENGVRVLRVPHYVPRVPTGPRRLLHHISFAASAALPALAQAITSRPDLVVAIAPSLISAPLARAAARLCGAPGWLHVQDFELDAAIGTGLLPDAGRSLAAARACERAILRGFDTVSTISPQMMARLAEKGVPPQKSVMFPNWADIGPSPSVSSYRARWNIATPHVALYSGAIGVKQGVDIVIAARRLLAHRRDITFVVCGEGPGRPALEALAQGLPRMVFRDLQPKAALADLLGLATLHLLPQRAGAADLVLPSRLANMLASGRPVVATAAPGTGIADAVAGCGLVVAPGDEQAFAAAIALLVDAPQARLRLGEAARRRAAARWNRQSILDGAIARMEALARAPAPSRLALLSSHEQPRS